MVTKIQQNPKHRIIVYFSSVVVQVQLCLQSGLHLGCLMMSLRGKAASLEDDPTSACNCADLSKAL